MNCPNEHGEMKKIRRTEETTFRGRDVRYEIETWACETCGLEAEDTSLAGENQRALSEAYRKAAGLLTSADIVEGRKERGWSQEELARAVNVGVASVKRWERGQIQTPVMDGALRAVFAGRSCNCDPYTGNRALSLGRIKLVLTRLGERLKRDLMKGRGNRLLYAAKYLWYSDMLSFRETGRSMTGAAYAALPHGPQINNYAELIDAIREADVSAEGPLTDAEERILQRIAWTFPTDQSVYQASHQEKAWESKGIGALIPYSDADALSGL